MTQPPVMTPESLSRYEYLKKQRLLTDGERKEYEELRKVHRVHYLREQQKEVAGELRGNIGQWMRDDWTPVDLAEALVVLVEESAEEISPVKVALREEIETIEGERLKQQMVWLDAQNARMGELLSKANFLLTKAKKVFKVPQGTMRIAYTESGEMYVDPKLQPKEWKVGDPVQPKYEKVTDFDRGIELEAEIAPFERYRAEIANIVDSLTNRRFLSQRVLDDLEKSRRAGL